MSFYSEIVHKFRVAILAIMGGLSAFAFGCWLMWDIFNWSLLHDPYIEGAAWKFYWPFFYGYVDATRNSLPFDYGLAIAIIGLVIFGLGWRLFGQIEEKLRK